MIASPALESQDLLEDSRAYNNQHNQSLTERIIPTAKAEEAKDNRKVRSNSEHNHGSSSADQNHMLSSAFSPRSNIQKYTNEYKQAKQKLMKEHLLTPQPNDKLNETSNFNEDEVTPNDKTNLIRRDGFLTSPLKNEGAVSEDEADKSYESDYFNVPKDDSLRIENNYKSITNNLKPGLITE